MKDFGKYKYIITEVCGGKKAEQIVPKIIPILVSWAENGESDHTYSDLSSELGYNIFSGIGDQLGYVADVLYRLQEETRREIPTLNGLIRSKNSNLPSSGFKHVHESFNELKETEKTEIVKNKNKEAINYKEWNWVLSMLGLDPLKNNQASFFPNEIIENARFREGLGEKVCVNRYERSAEARKMCIKVKGCRCSVCGFDFEKKYGDIGQGFIHVHHIIPISEIGEDYEVDYEKDLIPVCPNCHAMLHRKNPPYTIEELKDKIKD